MAAGTVNGYRVGCGFGGAQIRPFWGGRFKGWELRLAMARPEGVGSALTAYRMPIEGRDEWLAAVARHFA